MTANRNNNSAKFSNLKIYHELMANKVSEILLVSCPYDAFIMEEEGRLSTRIINEYKGLNLSKPPRITWVDSAFDAFLKLKTKKFDLIIAMPSIDGTDVYLFGAQVKKKYSDLPFFMLLHDTCDIDNYICHDNSAVIDRTYIWGGNTDLLLAIIKNFEDARNVDFDTKNANVRVIIMVEDSPYHYSSFLPVLYRQIVLQTQSVIDDSINEEHRLLKMRGRPKILVAQNYEEAIALYEKYKPFLLSIFSDMRYPRKGVEDKEAGYKLLKKVKKEIPDLPVLILSTEEHNEQKAADIPAVFINKNSSNLNDMIKSFFVSYLGFGAFVFRMPDGEEIARASDLRTLEKLLDEIPDESIVYHAMNNDFSRWFMARSEIDFALSLKPYQISDFPDHMELKKFLIESIHARRKGSRQGQIIDFDSNKFDSDTDFVKIGNGSLGGKARGLAFLSSQTKKDSSLQDKFPGIDINIPQTFVISTQGFKAFIEENKLLWLLETDEKLEDEQIVEHFIKSSLPGWLEQSMRAYLQNVRYPIAVRSSSLFEDAHYQPFAGLYNTYMLSNAHPNLEKRLEQLITAIKLVYASTYLKAPRSYAKSKYPQFLPQFSMINDILENSQKYFYALKLDDFPDDANSMTDIIQDPAITKLDLNDAIEHPSVKALSSTYHVQDNKIRDSFSSKGFPVLTFAHILKYNSFPLPELLEEVTKIGSKWMGSSVEVEFAVNLPGKENEKPQFSLLQIRPMGRYKQNLGVQIGQKEISRAFCFSKLSLGNGEYKDIYDIIYVDPEIFDPTKTVEIAAQINKINALFNKTGQKYVLIGPGRWGSSDSWLGIPVSWNDISNVGVMIETTVESIKADPSQGSHFFQNITSLGISYITVSDKGDDFINYDFFRCQTCENTTTYLKHIKFDDPIKILVDGKTSQAVLMPYTNDEPDDIMNDIPIIKS